MIAFLRKIRQSMIEKGNKRRYALYAIGEIALVVIGILIALQINNWNEERARNAKIQTYLQSMRADLANDTLAYRGSIDKDKFRYYALQYLLEKSNQTQYDPTTNGWLEVPAWTKNWIWKSQIPSSYDLEFIERAFEWSYRSGSPIIETSTIEELKSTGQFSYLKSKILKEQINDYYSTYERLFGPQELNKPIEEDWNKSLIEDGVLPYDLRSKDNPLSLFNDNPQRVAILKRVIARTHFNIGCAMRLKDKTHDLTNLIEEELAKY